MAMTQRHFSCDWGTTHFRLQAIEPGAERVAAETHSSQGVAALAQGGTTGRAERFRTVLATALQALKTQVDPGFERAPVAISGMASSSIGWQELPYGLLPLALDGGGLPWTELAPIENHRLALISGLASKTDVLRGEETQALGAFHRKTLAPLAAGCLLILPGTHSKHLQIADYQVRHFQTFMTGELFAVLSQHSLLRHSVGEVSLSPEPLQGETLEAFRAGVGTARQTPLSAALFRVRTRQVLDGQGAPSNRAFLSGVLIGSELAYLATQRPPCDPLLLGAPPALSAAYCLAIETLGLRDRSSILSSSDQALLSARGQAVFLRQIGWI